MSTSFQAALPLGKVIRRSPRPGLLRATTVNGSRLRLPAAGYSASKCIWLGLGQSATGNACVKAPASTR